MAVEDLSGVYNVTPYEWDGKERPNLSDYTEPWLVYASKSDAKWYTKKGIAYQNAVNFARDRLKIAEQQYNADLDFWNERDSRDYNDPLSQTNRYTEAGYNLGYLYGSVESGNTSSGYNGSSSNMSDFGSDAPEKDLTDAVEIVTGAVRIVTDLAETGIDLSKTPTDKAFTKWRTTESFQRGMALSLQNQWTNILRDFDKDGNSVDDYTKSLSFALEQSRLGQIELSNKQMTSFLEHCDDIYKNQATDIRKDLMEDIDKMLEGVDSDGVKAVLRLLAIFAMSKAEK